ncbi:hypothetical protein Agub_g435 [Astrephomene gubernaculifera]|uniref:Condensin-2 complex subunit H2 n=1 Tax=Astrephomene gubernaculifera TaxID=47775 RepID=A0AAD3HH06_9CHLO|nr:hypothetical protein Agub_g435 [Astrephomene gubernaculifera]
MEDLDDFADLKENRFAHLLKPIRDLQENFSIDLAGELEEYLELLEHAEFSFEGDRQGMVDFAQAALVIQGSTCVYSKKVEYLYNLVYQALEAVKGRKRQQVLGPDGQPIDGDAVPQQAGARGRVARAAEEDEDEGLERFWDVEPLLKQSADIDLAPGDGLLANTGNNTRPPAALLALEDQGQSAASSAEAKGDGDSGVYRLQQCVVHCSGTLLLDARDGDFYDSQLRFIGPQPRHDNTLEMMINDHQLGQPVQLMPMPMAPAKAADAAPGPAQQDAGDPNAAHAGAAMDMDPAQAQDYYDDDGGGGAGGGDWPSDDEFAEAAGPDKAGAKDLMNIDGVSVGGDGSARTVPMAAGQPHQPQAANSGAAAPSVGNNEADAEGEEEVFDPYKPLDPAAKSRLPDKPLVVRRPRKSRRNPTKTARAREAGPSGASGLLLPEFSYCLAFLRPASRTVEDPHAQMRGAATTGLKARPERVALARGGIAAPIFDARDAAAAVAADEAADADPAQADQEDMPPAAQPYGFDDDDNYGGGGASDVDDDVDPLAPGGGFGAAAAWHQPDGAEADDADTAARTRDGVWPGGVPPMGQLGGPDGAMAVDGVETSYEELCRAHMESMLMAAAAREVQSDLARRVSSWRQRIDPVLQAEESRPAFDIQDYGERILGRLAELKISDKEQQQGAVVAAEQRAPVNFGVVARELQKFEVSRMFSAMLQLINNRNVALFMNDTANVPPGEVPDEPFKLRLLSTDMYHKTMGERLAVHNHHQAGGAAGAGEDGGDDEDVENRATQRGRAKQGSGGRGKAVGGGAKRAKKAHAAPLADANADD